MVSFAKHLASLFFSSVSSLTSCGEPQHAARRSRASSEPKRSRASPRPQFDYGVSHHQQEDTSSSHLEGDTSNVGNYIDNLLTYLDSPMTMSFDASSTPCSTPSSPFSPNQPRTFPTSPSDSLHHPATADSRPLARSTTRSSNSSSSCQGKARPGASSATPELDLDADANFLDEVLQCASQLEQEFLS